REKACIQAEIQKSRLNGRVHMLGYQSHSRLQEIARDHHVFVSTSVTAENGDCEGGAPVSLVEMAASGMPIV
ncbi:MAG: glycosyltransferase, partial [Burkholderiales bacterium]|nr:glycosyltransferase [Burkholderiales bacterium]